LEAHEIGRELVEERGAGRRVLVEEPDLLGLFVLEVKDVSAWRLEGFSARALRPERSEPHDVLAVADNIVQFELQGSARRLKRPAEEPITASVPAKSPL
jgi:hypothetical protein